VSATKETPSAALILDDAKDEDCHVLAGLRADPAVEFVDSFSAQMDALVRLRPAPDVIEERPRWAYYPWRRAAVKILGPRSYRLLRLDRNRNLITTDEQDRLGALRVGVVGLSSGHVIAHTLATQGLCGELRLTDFDDLELSNLNRVPASVFDLGINKAVVTARRIAELDPYLIVRASTSGVTPDGVHDFLDDLDVVIEECDSLDVKALVREQARSRRLPVLMATSDRGLVDVERFDLEPTRPIFHGLLGTTDTAELAGLSSQQKVPHVLKLVDVIGMSARAGASLLEVGHSLTTWPQLAGDVTLGAGAVAEAVRRIGLGEPLSSGRISLDVGAALDRLEEPPVAERPAKPEPVPRDEPSGVLGSVVTAANQAPSGGNAQPWTIEAAGDVVTLGLAPEHTSGIDVGFRGSAVAIGAAVFNACVAAAANGVVGRVDYTESVGRWPLRARVRLVAGADPDRARMYPAMRRRETNRRHGVPAVLSIDVRESLEQAARFEGARLRVLAERNQIETAADILAATDRLRYLTPRLHADMAAELRWPGDDDMDTGIDVRSLELDPGTLLTLDILKRPQVMAALSAWDGGTVLGQDTRARVMTSTALAVVTVDGRKLTDYARGGAAAESVWITAQDRGLSVQPISPLFLYAQDNDELGEVSPTHAAALTELRSRFLRLADVTDESPALVLRLAVAPPASVRSRRRAVGIDGRGYAEPDVSREPQRQPRAPGDHGRRAVDGGERGDGGDRQPGGSRGPG
jgi:molybdopterin/thiamine biosynthesis adenylyltransferase